MNILTVEKNPDAPLPEWVRTVYFEDDGDIFIPAPATGVSEEQVFMAASFDGAGVVQGKGHTYFSLSWAENEFPKEKEVYAAIKRQVEKARKEMTEHLQKQV